jgi:peptidoglycan/xylan/chitin deacetylase (PgdA/CDA1 family)
MRRRALTLLAVAGCVALPGSASHVRTARAAPPPVVVTIQFDDGNADLYTGAFPILQAHGLHGTFYINSGVVGDSTHVTWDQLTEMAAAGDEIAGHTLTHVNLKHLKLPKLRMQICQDRVNLFDHGFQPTSFAYPFGSFKAITEQTVADCGYNSGRGVAGGSETIPPLDPYATRTPPNPKKGTSLGTIEGYITDAQGSGGGWVQLVFHHVCSGCDAYSITPTDFDALLTWIEGQQANGVTVETVDQVIGGEVKPPVAP